MEICKECNKRGRYSKSNLKIDLREIKNILETKNNIMASEYVELSLSKEEIIKRLLDRSLLCNCKI